MRLSRSLFLASAATIAIAGFAGSGLAQSQTTRVMTVRLPDGTLEQIRYSGDVQPEVVFVPRVVSPFAMLERMSADMDRQIAAMMRAVSTMPTMANPGFGFAAAESGSGVCMRSMQITYTGQGQPHVVSQTSGDCGAAAGGQAVPAEQPVAPLPHRDQRTIEVKANAPLKAQPIVLAQRDPG
jgi:hypothetical protein